MKIRYYVDPETDLPHIYRHDVSEDEVEQVLGHPGEDRPGRDGSRVAIGQTSRGCYLRAMYVADPDPQDVFVITACAVRGKPLFAYRRRRRRKTK